ncbi:MAG: hypothetical protein D6772_01935 [Bacteroidetes bacterium]|nr:MAG: hypothetical protein D6772_01935 [Bacteroidota bacterium]
MELAEALAEFVRQRAGEGILVGKVTAVKTDDFLIDCVDGDGNEYLDVRLNATPGLSGLLLVPPVGASVLISDLGQQAQDYVMIQASEVAEVYIYVDAQTRIFVDDTVIELGGGKLEPAVLGDRLNTNLGELIDKLDDLLTALNTFCTSQNAAAVGTLAPLAPAYAALSSSVASIKTQLATVDGDLPNHLSATVKVSD